MSQHQKNNNEEIDLGDLFRLLKKGVQYILNLFLRFIAFILKHAIVLAVLIIIGAIVGYFLQKKSGELVKTEMIIASNFGSSEYVFNSINQISYQIGHKDTLALEKLGIPLDAGALKLEIKPIVNISRFSQEEETFLELVSESNFINEEEKAKMFARYFRYYKVILSHPKKINSAKILNSILQQLRDNPYYQEYNNVNLSFLNNQIKANEKLISEIDSLVGNYSKAINKQQQASSTFYNSANNLDLGVVIQNRNQVQDQLQYLYREKVANAEFLRLVDLGTPTEIKEKGITYYKVILIPLLLVLGYFGLIIFVKVVQKARKLD
ncbi:hypothetical protein [Mesonia mobilis]|uniref:Chain length determinant protein n=1 Tax=Mesonia mobilis TaxID=369791 RepID=A0ABQ3BXA8_9FLAO|nr:hypothetical protein [Mesonia mobilis]MBQ0737113.1 hypothetical protein [Aquimarina celericrescens]GGZ60278.1 hypothetical protein GCM10008088_22210 [Mesonia mobilis]